MQESYPEIYSGSCITELSGINGYIRDAFHAENTPVSLHLGWIAERLGIVVGQLHGWPSFHVGKFAHQANGIKGFIAPRIAVAKIVGQQGAPSSTEADAPLRRPHARIQKVRSV